MGETEGKADILAQWLSEDGVRLLDAISGGAPDVVGVTDRDFIIRYVNWTAPGLSRSTVVGFSVFNIIPPGYAEVATQCFEKAFFKGEGSSFETLVRIDDAVLIWSVRVGPIHHGDQVVGAFTISTDVTEQRQELVDRDRFFALSRDVLAVVTAEGNLKRINPEFGHVLGYEVAEVLGKPFGDFVHPEDIGPTMEHFFATQRGESPERIETRYRRRDGQYRMLAWNSTYDPITRYVYAVGRDVTDHRTMELRLRHALKMEAVGQLAGGIAHDFNNLMQAVLANLELAFATNSLTPTVADHLKDIEEAGQRAADLTKQLLMFSRRQPLRKEPLDMSELLRRIMKLLERLLPKSIEIDLRPGLQLSSISGDRTQMEQVILNLCVNARDAMEGKGRLTIETDEVTLDAQDCQLHAWAVPGRFVQLSVTDTGSGMTEEVKERIFDPFFTTKESHQGTGLGLATVYGIVEQHGGLVHVYSELGQGTTFKVYFPTDGRPALSEAVTSELAAKSEGRRATLLVAEDDERVRRPLLQVLEAAGYKTLPAVNGRDAVRLLGEHQDEVDLVLLDLVMPEMGGAEALVHVRALRPDVPLLFTSGYADERYRERLPADAEILEKPFRAQDLLARIRSRLDEIDSD